MAFESLGVVTIQGKARIADMLATGRSFKITSFVIGDGGYLVSDPTIALTPDPSITTFVYGNVFTAAVTSVAFPTVTCPVWTCIIPPASGGGYVGPIGSLYLIGTIVYSPILGDPLVGTTFIFSVSTRPLVVKGPLDSFQFQESIVL